MPISFSLGKVANFIVLYHPSLPGELVRHQQHILGQAARMLKPGGRLVYSTCTFNRTENEDIIESFLKYNRDFTLRPFALPGLKKAKAGMLRIWPHEARGEGHFIALLEKTPDSGSPARSGADSNTMRDNKRRTLEEVNNELASWMESPVQADGFLGETAIRLPKPCPDLEGLFVLRLGLHLSSIQGKTIRPHHALSAALYAKNRIQLGRDEAECFRKGEALFVPDGLWDYCCAEHLGWPLGWGKAVDGVLKNHYPKGLRNPGKANED